jgi:hypothetical protein
MCRDCDIIYALGRMQRYSIQTQKRLFRRMTRIRYIFRGNDMAIDEAFRILGQENRAYLMPWVEEFMSLEPQRCC